MAWYKHTIVKTVTQDVFVMAATADDALQKVHDYDWDEESPEEVEGVATMRGYPEEVTADYVEGRAT